MSKDLFKTPEGIRLGRISGKSPLIFSLHKNRISLHGIEFQERSGDIKEEILEWNKIRGVENEC